MVIGQGRDFSILKERKPTHAPWKRSIGALQPAPEEVDHPTGSHCSSASLALLRLGGELPVPRLDSLLLQRHRSLHLVVVEIGALGGDGDQNERLEEKGGEFRFGTNITFPKIDCRLARCCKKNSQLIFCHSGSSTCQVCPLFHCLLLLPTVATTATVRSFWPPPVLFFLPANDLSVIGLMEEGQTAFHHHRHHHCHYHFVIVFVITIVIINPLGNYYSTSVFPRYRSTFLQYQRIKGAPEGGGPWPALLLEMWCNLITNCIMWTLYIQSSVVWVKLQCFLLQKCGSFFYTGEYIRHAPVLLGFLFKLYVLQSIGGIGYVLYNVPAAYYIEVFWAHGQNELSSRSATKE